MVRSAQQAVVGRPAAAIHDLGYRRYVGTRRPQSTRWRVLVVNVVTSSWRGWWRMKAWAIASAITAVSFGVAMTIARNQALQPLTQRGMIKGLIDGLIPQSFRFFHWFAFLLASMTAAGAVARDLRAGAFEFYFSRPVRPLDYTLGAVVGHALVLSTALLAGPVLLSLYRVGLPLDVDEILPALVLVPRVALVGVLGSLAYASVALAFSSLSSRPRVTIAMWAAFYLLFGGIADALAITLRAHSLAAINLPGAVLGAAFGLFQVNPSGFGTMIPGLKASLLSLLGYSAAGLVILQVRVKRAERAGLGGG